MKNEEQTTGHITCDYITDESIISEAIGLGMYSQRRSTIFIVVMCALLGVVYLFRQETNQAIVWFLLAALAFGGEIFFSNKFVGKRQVKRYIRRFGTEKVHIKAVFGSTRIHYHVNDELLNFHYGAIQRIKESDRLLVLLYQAEMVILLKDKIKNGTVEELKEYIEARKEEAKKMRKSGKDSEEKRRFFKRLFNR